MTVELQHISELIDYKGLIGTDQEPLFDIFHYGDKSQKTFRSLGIDGVVSAIVTRKMLDRYLKSMKFTFDDLQLINPTSPLYKNLMRRLGGQKRVLVGKRTHTEFYCLPLGTRKSCSLRNCLLVTFNDAELNEYCATKKKKVNHYCRVSLQSLNQPTRTIDGRVMEAFHLMFKKLKIEFIDVAADVKKKGNIEDKLDYLSSNASRLLDSKISVVSPEVADNDPERSCYLNVVSPKKGIKSILFYDKFTKHADRSKQNIASVYRAWHRIEAKIVLPPGMFKKNNDFFFLSLWNFVEFIKGFSIIDRSVSVDFSNFDLLKIQIQAMAKIKLAKKLAILPDVKLFGTATRTEQEDQASKLTKMYKTFVNRIVQSTW